MSKILELRTKRNTLWEQTKDFLEKNRGENGLVKAEAVEQYNKMAQEVKDWVQRLSVWSSRHRSRHSCPHRLPALSTLTRRAVPRRMSSRLPLPSMPRTSGT